MITHANIWRAIDRLATVSGYSASGLAKKAGLDPTTFNKSKRTSADGKPRWPSTESVAKILAVTQTTMSEFTALVEDDTDIAAPGRVTCAIPVIGMAQAGRAGYFDDAGYPTGTGWDEVEFPDDDGKRGDDRIFALEVTGDSMQPLYRHGDIIVLSPEAKTRKGDRVVVRTRKGEVMAKELIKHYGGRVDLKSLNPEHPDRSLKVEDVLWMARIIWVSQ